MLAAASRFNSPAGIRGVVASFGASLVDVNIRLWSTIGGTIVAVGCPSWLGALALVGSLPTIVSVVSDHDTAVGEARGGEVTPIIATSHSSNEVELSMNASVMGLSNSEFEWRRIDVSVVLVEVASVTSVGVWLVICRSPNDNPSSVNDAAAPQIAESADALEEAVELATTASICATAVGSVDPFSALFTPSFSSPSALTATVSVTNIVSEAIILVVVVNCSAFVDATFVTLEYDC